MVYQRFLLAIGLVLFLPLYSTPLGAPANVSQFIGLQIFKEEIPDSFDSAKLEPGWWRYFDVDDEELELRVAAAQTELRRVYGGLDWTGHPVAKQAYDRALSNLLTLPKVRRLQSPVPRAPSTFQEHYALEEFLTLKNLEKEKKQEYSTTLVDLAHTRELREDLEDVFFREMTLYLEIPDRTTEKLKEGIKVIALWSAYALKLEQERLKEGAIQTFLIESEYLQEELTVAQQRIDSSSIALDQLKRRALDLEEELQRLNREVMESEVRVLASAGGEKGEKDQEGLERQRLVSLSVQEGLLRTRLLNALLEQELFTLIEEPKVGRQRLENVLGAWEEQLAGIHNQVRQWRSSSHSELNSTVHKLSQKENGAPLVIGENVAEKRLSQAQDTLLLLEQVEVELTRAFAVLELLDELYHSGEQGVWGFLKDGSRSLWSKARGIPEWISWPLFHLGAIPVTIHGILRCIFILFLAWIFSKVVRKLLFRISEQNGSFHRSFFYNLGRLSHYVILIFGLSFALASLGIDFTSIVLVAGALSVGIGFGLQSIFNNFVSGLILLVERSLNVGDYVELGEGLRGTVQEISVRSTLIHTNDGIDVIVPNSEFMRERVINWTLEDTNRRLRIPFSVAYGSDKNLVQKAALEAADRVSFTFKKKGKKRPKVQLIRFGDSSLDFELVVWLDSHGSKHLNRARSSYLWALDDMLQNYQIEVPYPHREVIIKKQESPDSADKNDRKSEDES